MSPLSQTEHETYQDVPLFRRRGVWVATMLLLTPIGIILALTGEIYLVQRGEVKKLPAALRIMVALSFGAMMAGRLLVA